MADDERRYDPQFADLCAGITRFREEMRVDLARFREEVRTHITTVRFEMEGLHAELHKG
jgi:hypothetical protein